MEALTGSRRIHHSRIIRRKIGASMMLTIIRETVLLFVVDTLLNSFEDLEIYMNDEIEKDRGQ